MSWRKLEEESPELAVIGYERLNRKITYLAILNQDGSPRLHPVTPFIGGGMLFMFTKPDSPKIRDLKRDGRYAIHCAVGGGGPLLEFLVSGTAEAVSDPKVWTRAAELAKSPVVLETYTLFVFQVQDVLLVQYDEDGKREIRRWRIGQISN